MSRLRTVLSSQLLMVPFRWVPIDCKGLSTRHLLCLPVSDCVSPLLLLCAFPHETNYRCTERNMLSTHHTPSPSKCRLTGLTTSHLILSHRSISDLITKIWPSMRRELLYLRKRCSRRHVYSSVINAL